MLYIQCRCCLMSAPSHLCHNWKHSYVLFFFLFRDRSECWGVVGEWGKSTCGVSARREYGTRPQVSWDVNYGTQGNPQSLQKKEIIFLPTKTDGDKATGPYFMKTTLIKHLFQELSDWRGICRNGYSERLKDFKDSYRVFQILKFLFLKCIMWPIRCTVDLFSNMKESSFCFLIYQSEHI